MRTHQDRAGVHSVPPARERTDRPREASSDGLRAIFLSRTRPRVSHAARRCDESRTNRAPSRRAGVESGSETIGVVPGVKIPFVGSASLRSIAKGLSVMSTVAPGHAPSKVAGRKGAPSRHSLACAPAHRGERRCSPSCSAPAGLPPHAWYFFAIFAGVIVGLMVEPLPGGAVGLIGVTVVTLLAPYVLFSPRSSRSPASSR